MRACLFFGLLSLLAAWGCGSSHSVDDAGPGSDATTGDAASADAGGGSDAAAPTDAAPSGDAAVSDSGPGTDAGGGGDAGSATDAGGARDGGGTPMEIDCMGMTCDAASEQCCVMGSFGGASASCIPRGDTCEGGTVDCDGPEDCGPSEVCCGTGGLGGVTVECRASSEPCGGPGSFSEFELCHEASDCTDDGAMCCPLMMLGFSGGVCQPRCFGGGFP